MRVAPMSGGCGCKIGAAELLPLLAGIDLSCDERVLVGSATVDDAAVYSLNDHTALVQTIDFFPPPVDDPYDFGRIAAANALSDVYAMGARPLIALNVVGFPADDHPLTGLAEILRGGADVCRLAGVSIVGGHSIRQDVPTYGLAVTGTAHPRELLRNNGGGPGDALVLTKPLGVGAVLFAERGGDPNPERLRAAVDVMTRLNASASEAALGARASTATDVTGFGLLGHLHHVARESGLAAEVDAATVPAIPGADVALAESRAESGGARRNREWSATFTFTAAEVEPWRRRLLDDPTTSGGLLVGVPAERASQIPGTVIGRLVEGTVGYIEVS